MIGMQHIEDQINKRPLLFLTVIVLSYVGISFLLILGLRYFPNHEVIIAQLVIWVFLLWSLYTGIPIIRYIHSKFKAGKRNGF